MDIGTFHEQTITGRGSDATGDAMRRLCHYDVSPRDPARVDPTQGRQTLEDWEPWSSGAAPHEGLGVWPSGAAPHEGLGVWPSGAAPHDSLAIWPSGAAPHQAPYPRAET